MSSMVPVFVPYLGVSIEEATVIAWRKSPGESVAADDVICELASDKVDIEVTAPAAGILASCLADEGGVAAVGSILAEIEATSDRIESQPTPPAPTSDAAAQPLNSAVSDRRGQGGVTVTETATPDRSLAEPTTTRSAASAAPPMRAIRYDYRASAEALWQQRAEVERQPRRWARPATSSVDEEAHPRRENRNRPTVSPSAGRTSPLLAGYEDIDHDVVPHSRRRRLIAEHMVRSRAVAAHMTTTVEVDMTRVAAARAKINSTLDVGVRVTYLAFVAYATCTALRRHRDLNATFTDDALLRWRPIHLGVAVDAPDGLIVPVVRDADRRDLRGLAEQMARLAEAARQGTLAPSDVRGATFTISNPGAAGATSAMAIINQPQVAILGMPVIVRRVVALPGSGGEDLICARPMLELALTYDHRAVDGAAATRCAVDIKDTLERWSFN